MDKTMVEQEIILRRKLDLLLRTGKILVESAADTNRIVRNMNRVAAYLGLPEEMHRVRYQSVYEHHHCGAGVHMSGLYHHLYRAFGHALPSAAGVRTVHCAGSSHYKLCGRHD